MNTKIDEIRKEVEELVKTGKHFYRSLVIQDNYYTNGYKEYSENDIKEVRFFLNNYEKWYTAALRLIKQILPEREKDFISLYKSENRKELNWQNYTLSDAVQQKANKVHSFHPGNALEKMMQQVVIVETCLDSFDKKVFDIQVILSADVFDSELDTAKHLCNRGFLRASGAIAGVVLEKHFSSICQQRNIKMKKRTATIADYNDALKDVVYDTLEWRRIQRLGDLRNLCDHNKDREPTKDEVEELIGGVERVIKTIF